MFCSLHGELLARVLSRHLAAEGVDSASDARDEMSDVGVGAVHDVLGMDRTSARYDRVTLLEIVYFQDRRVRFDM